MKFITLTTADIHITNKGTRLEWQPDSSLIGNRIELISIKIIGININLYRLEYISRDDGSLWSNRLTFDSDTSSVKCINISSGHNYRYNQSQVLAFNLYNDQHDPVRNHLIYSDVLIELAIDQ
jgi:hypothetical protein